MEAKLTHQNGGSKMRMWLGTLVTISGSLLLSVGMEKLQSAVMIHLDVNPWVLIPLGTALVLFGGVVVFKEFARDI